MNLLGMFRRKIGFSMLASVLNLAITFTVVQLAGPVIYADFTVDIYKIALIMIVLEVVPSPYATFQSQRDPALASHLATFSIVSSVFCIGAWLAVAGLGLFASPSAWMAGYVVYLALQRYVDIKLQAENRIAELYQLLTIGAALRLVLIGVGLGATALTIIDVLWGSLTIASLLSIGVWLVRNPAELRPFMRSGHFGSLAALIRERKEYYGYYANSVLKRLRDSFMPIAAAFLMTDRVELARYLLAMRGLEAAMGQLRVAEALLANFANRERVAASRNRHLLVLALLAQLTVFALSLLLTSQLGVGWGAVLVSSAASFFALPYVFEIAYRSDAYAAHQPVKVTTSLLAFSAGLAAGFLLLWKFEILSAPAMVATHVAAQTLATLSYHLRKKRRAAEE